MPSESETAAPKPDILLVSDQPNRLADGGPRYKETPPDPAAVPYAEPWNAVTASFFIIIVLVWLWRLRGRYLRYPFVVCCMPILLAGGIGGTLYHAFRTQKVWFLMDVIPISLLGAAGSIYLTIRLGRIYGLGWVLAAAVGLVGVYLAVNMFVFRLIQFPNPNWPVNLSYASLAAIMIIPLIVVLIRTRFRHVAWVAGSLLSFGIAWFCRLVDNTPWGDLPMGTHWLWHTFGAITTHGITEYFYRLEGKPLEW